MGVACFLIGARLKYFRFELRSEHSMETRGERRGNAGAASGGGGPDIPETNFRGTSEGSREEQQRPSLGSNEYRYVYTYANT